MELRRSMRTRKLKWGKSNYKELSAINLPRGIQRRPKRVTKPREQLYAVDILERGENGRIKVHYIGYDSEYDEWKGEDELEDISEHQSELPASPPDSIVETYSLYRDLGVRIKRGLLCSRTSSPVIKIVMPFDVLLFNGGLKEAGVPSKRVGGIQHYKISHYRDLNHLLGQNWHVRGINANGDYGYVTCDTVDFCLKKSRKIDDYLPTTNGPRCHKIDPGYVLTFSFVCNYGLPHTFGKDTVVFYE